MILLLIFQEDVNLPLYFNTISKHNIMDCCYIKMDNADSYRLKDIYKERFISKEKSLELCNKENYTGFVVFNNIVYYRNIKFKLLISNFLYNNSSTFYIIIPDEYKDRILSIEERNQFYTKGIYNNKYTFKNKSNIMTLNSIKNKIESLKGDRKKEHHENLYNFLLINNINQNQYFKINPYDVSWGIEESTFVKSRPANNPKKSILFPLEDVYAPCNILYKIKNDIPFEKKNNLIVWRGVNSGYPNKTQRASRLELVEKYFNNEFCDIGFSNMSYKENIYNYEINKEKIIKGVMSIDNQLKFKFIISVEGNDSATNLGWILLSNSIPICPKHFIETWNIESKLEPWKHYVPVQNDFSDLIINYHKILEDEELCNNILVEKKLFISQFLNKEREDKIIKNVIDIYFTNTSL